MCLLLLGCALVATAHARMTIRSLTGPVTAADISSFESFMAGESPPSGQTYDNTIADGTDTLTGAMREKKGAGIHLSAQGLQAHADLWVKQVGPWLAQQLKQ